MTLEETTIEVDLSQFRQGDYTPGRGLPVRTLWYVVSLLLFESGWFPFSRIKIALLNLFGANIGRQVVIKPHVRIKFPWRLRVGDRSWIGQGVWIDNLAPVEIGADCCLSQESYFCTGSHDHRRRSFDLVTQPICVESGAWICARATILSGATIGREAIVTAGSVVRGAVPSRCIYAGNPAVEVGQRTFHSDEPA